MNLLHKKLPFPHEKASGTTKKSIFSVGNSQFFLNFATEENQATNSLKKNKQPND